MVFPGANASTRSSTSSLAGLGPQWCWHCKSVQKDECQDDDHALQSPQRALRHKLKDLAKRVPEMLNRVLEQDGGEEADARSLSALQRLEGRQSCRLALRLRQDRGGQDEREPATADRADRARARARAVWQMGERSEDEDPQGQLLDSVFSVIIMLLDRTGRLRPDDSEDVSRPSQEPTPPEHDAEELCLGRNGAGNPQGHNGEPNQEVLEEQNGNHNKEGREEDNDDHNGDEDYLDDGSEDHRDDDADMPAVDNPPLQPSLEVLSMDKFCRTNWKKEGRKRKEEKDKILHTIRSCGVRKLKEVNGTRDPKWVKRLLRHASPLLEELQIFEAGWDQLEVALQMPNLRSLDVSGNNLLQGNSREGPEVPADRHRHPRLQFLDVGYVPRNTVESMLRVHGPTLKTLVLWVGTQPLRQGQNTAAGAAPDNWPKSCSDLPQMLAKYKLVALEKLVLTRQCSFTHKAGKCQEQIRDIREVLPRRQHAPRSRQQAQVFCTTCNKDELEAARSRLFLH